MWPLWFDAHKRIKLLPMSSQAAQAQFVRRSSCVISVMTKMKEFLMGIFTTALRK